MRVSSVIVLPSRGTFRSQRIRTFFPLSSSSARSEIDFLAMVMFVAFPFCSCIKLCLAQRLVRKILQTPPRARERRKAHNR